MNRRHFIATASAAVASSAFTFPEIGAAKSTMGVSIASYAIRWRSTEASSKYPGFSNALEVLEHCQRIGAGGVQIGVGGWAAGFSGKVRDLREDLGMYLEGQIALPKDDSDVERFEQEALQAREAGATILRAVCLRGRRYETFDSFEAFQRFREDSLHALELAEPIMRRHRIKLAIENHKDWRVPELIAIMNHLDSEWIGVTLDTGNNISLLEDPMAVVEGLAPYTITTHFKDMGVESYEDGFLLAEVPLGAGFLDLRRIVEVCQKHNPAVQFNLEMITRDPLEIPCMTDAYWQTFSDVPGRDLARTLRMVEKQQPQGPLPRMSGKNPEERLAFEEENVRSSFTFAREVLGLTG